LQIQTPFKRKIQLSQTPFKRKIQLSDVTCSNFALLYTASDLVSSHGII